MIQTKASPSHCIVFSVNAEFDDVTRLSGPVPVLLQDSSRGAAAASLERSDVTVEFELRENNVKDQLTRTGLQMKTNIAFTFGEHVFSSI